MVRSSPLARSRHVHTPWSPTTHQSMCEGNARNVYLWGARNNGHGVFGVAEYLVWTIFLKLPTSHKRPMTAINREWAA